MSINSLKNPITKLALARNLSFGVLLQAGTYVAGFLTTPYLSRVLGAADFGAVAFTIGVNAYIWMFVDWGFGLAGTRAVAAARSDPDELTRIFWRTISAKVILAAVTVVVVGFVLACTRTPGINITVAPALLNLSAICFSLDWFVQGMERIGAYAVVSTGARFCSVFLTLIFVRSGGDVWLACIFQALTGVFGSLGGLWITRHMGLFKRPMIDLRQGFISIWHGRHYFLTQANAVLWGGVGPIILEATSGPAQVGYFAAADKFDRLVLAAFSPIAMVMYPRTAALIQTDRRGAAREAGISLLLQTPFAAAASFAFALFPEHLTLLIFGRSMGAAGEVLRWLAPVPLINVALRVVTTQALIPLGRAREVSSVIMGVTFISLIIFIFLAKEFGAIGAAQAFLITESMQLILLTIILRYLESEYFSSILIMQNNK